MELARWQIHAGQKVFHLVSLLAAVLEAVAMEEFFDVLRVRWFQAPQLEHLISRVKGYACEFVEKRVVNRINHQRLPTHYVIRRINAKVSLVSLDGTQQGSELLAAACAHFSRL